MWKDGEFDRVGEEWGMRGGMRNEVGKFREHSGENSKKIPENSRKLPEEYGIDHVGKSDIVKPHIKSFEIGLKEKNLAIILYPPIEYLRKCNLIRIRHLFPTTLLFFDSLFKGDLHVLLFSLKA